MPTLSPQNAVTSSCRRLGRLAGAALIAVASSVPFIAVPIRDALSGTAGTIKIVVPLPPGGPLDVVSRLLAEQVARVERRTIIVESRPGASHVIGTEAVSRATPDGNTLLVTANPFVINPHVRKLNYDPLNSFEPICELARAPLLILVNDSSPHRTLADLLNAARARPGEVTLAATGPVTLSRIAVAMLERAANVHMNFVSYPGAAPTVNALLGEQVMSGLTDYSSVAGHLRAGKLRALATMSRHRIEALPDVPGIAESGYGDSEAELWIGMVAPANTPKEAISRIAGWVTAAMRAPDINAKLAAQGLHPAGICGAEFGARLRKQYDEYGRIIREMNITVE